MINSDILSGRWKQIKGALQEKWGKLTNDHMDRIEGDATRLAGVLQEEYGLSREEAEREIENFLKSVESPPPPSGGVGWR